MKIIYSPLHIAHNPPSEIYDGVFVPYADKPERLEAVVNILKQKDEFDFSEPKKFSLSHILTIHQRQYLQFVKSRSRALRRASVLYPSYFMTDTYAPIVHDTYNAAKAAVDVALTGAQLLLENKSFVYSLCRPPGHHAEHASMGGYCYFNNAAIAAQYLTAHGRVAILDIDFHHGNGTQRAFYERSDVLYISIHGDPRSTYPYSSGFESEHGKGAGRGFSVNYPLPLGTGDKVYAHILTKALFEIKKYEPVFLIVSAGFDTFCDDPIGGFELSESFYQSMGKKIAALALPTLVVQEGGYNVSAIGSLVHRFLRGFLT